MGMVRCGKFGVHTAGFHSVADFFQQRCGVGRIVGRQLSRILGICDEYFHGGRGGAGAHSRYGIRSSRHAAENIFRGDPVRCCRMRPARIHAALALVFSAVRAGKIGIFAQPGRL